MGTRTIDRRRSDSPHRAPILDRFGVVVRLRREGQHLTRAELEQRSGIPRNYIGSIERGEINPTLLTQQRIAQGLGVRLGELVTEAEDATAPLGGPQLPPPAPAPPGPAAAATAAETA